MNPIRINFSDFKALVDVLSGLGVIAVALLLLWDRVAVRANSGGSGPSAVVAMEPTTLSAAAIQNIRGDSKTVIVEFADYECPFCGQHARNTFPRLMKEVVGAGTVSYAYVQFPLDSIHSHALPASIAAECAGQQNRFWEMHDTLFENQKALANMDFPKYAQRVGMDVSKFSECFDKGETPQLKAEMEEGRRLDVTGTPSFFIGVRQADGSVKLTKRINGAVPFETFRTALELDGSRHGWRGWFDRLRS